MADCNHLFTYGDRIRRKAGGTVHAVADVVSGTYHFTDGTFALVADQDCYDLVEKASGFFRVSARASAGILDDHLHHGYEDRSVFAAAIARLTERWGGRVGQSVGERNRFLLLRFHDTPGGLPDEAWLPLFLLTPCPAPPYAPGRDPAPSESIRDELDEAFGF